MTIEHGMKLSPIMFMLLVSSIGHISPIVICHQYFPYNDCVPFDWQRFQNQSEVFINPTKSGYKEGVFGELSFSF